MKRFTTLLFAIVLLGLGTGLNAQSLDVCLKIAAENNPLLKAKYAEFEAALQKTAQSGSLPDPTLSLGYFISPIETRVGPQRAKLGLSQMFPWFGTLKTTGNIYALQAEVKYQEFLDAKSKLLMQVKNAWYPIYEVHQHITIQESNKDILESYKQLAISGYKNDRNNMIDVIRVDIAIENTNTEIELLGTLLTPLQIRLNRILNRPDTSDVIIGQELHITDLPMIQKKDSLLAQHPMLQALERRIESAKESEELSRKNGLPTIGVGIDYVFIDSQVDMATTENGRNAIMPMVSMSIPIYRKKYNAATKEAQLVQESLRYLKEDAENTLISDYEMTLYEIERARKLVDLFDNQKLQMNQVLSLLESAYSNAGADFEEILRMQQDLLEVQMETVTATKDFHLAVARLQYLISKMD